MKTRYVTLPLLTFNTWKGNGYCRLCNGAVSDSISSEFCPLCLCIYPGCGKPATVLYTTGLGKRVYRFCEKHGKFYVAKDFISKPVCEKIELRLRLLPYG